MAEPFADDLDGHPLLEEQRRVCVAHGTVYRTWHTSGRGTEQLSHTFPMIDVLTYGRQEEWQDVPDGWPQGPTYAEWLDSERIADLYGDQTNHG
jgi:predicted dithiol-disulfide oxidoreductase (DUF899 family)